MQAKSDINPFYLIGYGGLAREVLGWLTVEKHDLLHRFAGFLVTNDSRSDALHHGYPVKHIDDITGGFSYLLTVSSPEAKEKITSQLSKRSDAKAESFVSSSTLIGLNVQFGRGVIVNPRSSISSDATIGDFTLINCNNGIAHDVSIGHYCSVLGSASLNGNVIIGNKVTIGSGAIIHPGIKVGDGSIVGMGAVVFRNVQPGTTVIGNPARKF